MENKDFYRQIVNRISSKDKSKTNRELTSIVLQNTFVDTSLMFDTKSIKHLFGDNLMSEAYEFIKENQHLYVDSQYMNYEQINHLLKLPNIIKNIKENPLTEKDSVALLNAAIAEKKITLIKHLMKSGYHPNTETLFFIERLTEKPEDITILQFLSSKNIDLMKILSGKLLLSAVMNDNSAAVEFLVKDIPIDHHYIKESVYKYVSNQYDSKLMTKQIKDSFPNIAEDMKEILNLLLPKLTINSYESIIHKIKRPELKEFLDNLYLVHKLDNNLTISASKTIRVKL